MSAESPLAVAIVGCGIIGVLHARAMALHPGLRIVSVVDASAESATALGALIVGELAGERPAEFATLTAALAGTAIDLVVICTPSGLHVQLAEEALAAGTHVVIEKPLDVSLERARHFATLASAAETRGQVVSVVSQHRFDPASVVVAAAAHEGRFGLLTSAVASVAWWRSQEYYDSGTWRGTWALDGGGAVMNQGVHTVDLLVWFLGRPVEIRAQTALLAHDRVEIEDVAVATIRFESGALAVLHATTAAYPGLTVRLQVHGSRGSAVINDDQLEYFHATADGAPLDCSSGNQASTQVEPHHLRGTDKQKDSFVSAHFRQYTDVVEAINSGRAPGVRVEDALISLAVVRSVYLSATLGTAVSFEAVFAGDFDEAVVSTGSFPTTGGAE